MHTRRVYFVYLLSFIDLQNETHKQYLVQGDLGKIRHFVEKWKQVLFLFEMLFSHFRITTVMHRAGINNK